MAQAHRNRELLIHSAICIELSAHDLGQLKLLQTEVMTERIRSRLNVDRLMLRQPQGEESLNRYEGYDSAGFDTELLDDAVEKSIRLALEDAQHNLWEQKWW